MQRSALLCILALCATFASAVATTHLVKPDGTGDYPTIQAAIDAAAPGDTICLDNGVFTGTGNKNLDTAGKAVVITSREGPDSSIIDCQGDGRGFHIHSDEGPGTVIERIQIRNGDEHEGGAIRIEFSSPTIVENIFYANKADSGGAVLADHSSSVITRNTFDRNEGKDPYPSAPNRTLGGTVHHEPSIRSTQSSLPFWPSAGAIFMRDCTMTLIANTFTRHIIDWGSDALCIFARRSTLTLQANTFRNNGGYSRPSAQVCAEDSRLEMAGNDFTGNESNYGCVHIQRCTGYIRANRLENTEGHIVSGIRAEDSQVEISFNLMARNSGPCISLQGTSAEIERNILAETNTTCINTGLGIYVSAVSSAAILDNLFYHNRGDQPGYSWEGYDLLYSAESYTCPNPEDNIFASPYSGSPVASVDHSGPTSGGMNVSWERGVLEFCYRALLIPANPAFRDATAGNFFLGESSECVGQGPLPVATGPADALTVTAAPDFVVAPGGGTKLPLTGFTITNDSPLDACVTYRLSLEGAGTLDDYGNPQSLVGSTPVLSPGESYSPPEAAVTAPDDAGVATIRYLYAYAPALNMVDTIVTHITFDTPVAVGLQSFVSAQAAGSVMLEWATIDALSPDAWRVYRSSEAGDILLTVTPLAPDARSFRDDTVEPAHDYEYTLASIESGQEAVLGRVPVRTIASALSLNQNTPNPFNPTTTIGFSLPQACHATLAVYTVAGALVTTLVDSRLLAGPHSFTWDGTDARGRNVASGVYLYRLRSGTKSLVRKMVLLK